MVTDGSPLSIRWSVVREIEADSAVAVALIFRRLRRFRSCSPRARSAFLPLGLIEGEWAGMFLIIYET
ncbi:MAG: hypothetical protein A2603_02975 [Bdellovibrionales bacterium RIFOXYD1_FULL_55_31]|nr:MAG: hypothetical protein A2603_02975 [Bdellovibrionales bacterium RIFOXYD1_FULL_55_31]